MGKPAARLGDMTVHGGCIVVGCPTVLIGSMPAARVGDNHVCPMLNPGVPPPPHVGGPIMPPGVPTVLIGGMPAACVGDMATCAGPPDTIAPPGCPTVMIGAGGGGGGGGGAAGAGSAAAETEAAGAEVPEPHSLHVEYVDNAGYPITGVHYTITDPDGRVSGGRLSGEIKRGGVPEGDHKIELRAITKAEWSVNSARVGDKVKLQAECAGIQSGQEATFDLFVKESRFAHRLLTSLPSTVQGDKIEAEWELVIDDQFISMQQEKKNTGGYSSPSYYFIVRAADAARRSGVLEYKDWIEVEYKDSDGTPLANKEYQVYLPNGEVRKGKLNSSGYAKIENLPPGSVQIKVDPRK